MDTRPKPCGVVSCMVDGRSFKVHLFRAKEWKDRPGVKPGRYRLMQGRSWFNPGGEKYEFFSLEQILALAGQHLRADADDTPPQSTKPDLRASQRVRWMRSSHPVHENPGIITWTLTPPFLAANGAWMIFLRGAGAGLVPFDPVPCAEIHPL